MNFQPLKEQERTALMDALRGNAESGLSILMNRRNTSFVGSHASDDLPTDSEVVAAIKSVPVHY